MIYKFYKNGHKIVDFSKEEKEKEFSKKWNIFQVKIVVSY